MAKLLELGSCTRCSHCILRWIPKLSKSKKVPDNLLKLGITMVQLGEKDQGCKMISGLKKEYPKASKSV